MPKIEDEGFGTGIKPDGVPGTCQCVRSHDTLVDGVWHQCREPIRDINHNGLCENCWETHGKALAEGKVVRQEH